MPYIPDKKLRKTLDEVVDKYDYALGRKGALNYMLFKFAKSNCKDYNDFRTFFGELTCAKKEIQRRLGKWHPIAMLLRYIMDEIYDDLAAPYEDKKIEENGDVE